MQGNLSEIRQQLYACSEEVAPLQYCPHITLGLYKDHINSDVVFERMQHIAQRKFEFQNRQLTFGTDHAQTLQGPLTSYHQVILGDA